MAETRKKTATENAVGRPDPWPPYGLFCKSQLYQEFNTAKVDNKTIECSVTQNIGVVFVYLPDFGLRLKKLRSNKNLSQTALGKLVSVSKSVISSYENEVHLPPYDVLISMAGVFGVSTDYLLGVSGNRSICVDGLTEEQTDAVNAIVAELKKANGVK